MIECLCRLITRQSMGNKSVIFSRTVCALCRGTHRNDGMLCVTARRPVTCLFCCHRWGLRRCSNSVAWRSADCWAETRWNTCCVCHCPSEDTCSTTASQSVLLAERETQCCTEQKVLTSDVSDSNKDSCNIWVYLTVLQTVYACLARTIH